MRRVNSDFAEKLQAAIEGVEIKPTFIPPSVALQRVCGKFRPRRVASQFPPVRPGRDFNAQPVFSPEEREFQARMYRAYQANATVPYRGNFGSTCERYELER